MKLMVAIIVFLGLGATSVMADITKDDMKKLLNAGMSDPILVEYIKTNAPARLTANDLIELKKAGASDAVLTALAKVMKGKSGGAGAAEQQETIYTFQYEPSYSYYVGGYYWWPYYGWGRCAYRYNTCSPRVVRCQPTYHCPPIRSGGSHVGVRSGHR